MKNTSKLILGLGSALILIILAIFFVTKFNSQESARVTTTKSSLKTSQTSSSSSRKSKSKTTKSSSTITSKSEASSDEAVSQPSAENQTSPKQREAVSEEKASSQSSSQTNVENDKEAALSQGGAWEATSGTLTLERDTPVYASADKSSGTVFMMDPGEVNWDNYISENGDYWYSFVLPGDNTRYYIAYSDVGH